ncbi:hypothetical protein SAMN04488131_10981 [Flavobacterium xueshanense]|uniref:Uncharacterized protein n=1 Tax=Flavobacterium xueshanense TaxID=935223 RepID=A0A1I2G7L7_9FLAO|nr:hypothetical protein SAMN04488131_10981 [Flavobacterium xueshanense]
MPNSWVNIAMVFSNKVKHLKEMKKYLFLFFKNKKLKLRPT